MAEEQDIKIKISTEANSAGADQTLNDLKEVEQQAIKTATASAGGFTTPPMGPERDEAAEAAEAAQKSLAEAMEATSAAHEKLLQDTRNADAARARSAQAAREQAKAEATLSQSIQQTASATRQMTFQLGAMAAGQLAQGIGQVNQELGGILATTAQGAAAAGPWGAAIGAILGSLTAVQTAQKKYNELVKETEGRIQANSRAVEAHSQKVNELRLKDSYQKQWQDLNSVIESVNQAVRDNIEIENARRAARQELGGVTREAEEASIRAQRQTGAISAQQEAAEIADLRKREAEANKQAAIADAQAQQINRQKALDAAKLSLEALEGERIKAERALAEAQAKLDSFVVDPGDRLGSASERGAIIAEIDAAAAAGKNAEGQIKAATDQVIAAQSAVNTGLQLLEIEVSKIGETFNAQGLTDQVKDLTEKSKAEAEKAAAEVQAAIAGIEPQNRAQQEALQGLNKAIADGELSKTEAAAAVQQLGILGNNLNTELGKMLGVVNQILTDQSARDRLLQNIIGEQKAQQARILEIAAGQGQ